MAYRSDRRGVKPISAQLRTWYFFCFACLYWQRLGYFMLEHTSATTIGGFRSQPERFNNAASVSDTRRTHTFCFSRAGEGGGGRGGHDSQARRIKRMRSRQSDSTATPATGSSPPIRSHVAFVCAFSRLQ